MLPRLISGHPYFHENKLSLSTNNAALPTLPNDVVSQIFHQLDITSLINAASVAKSWYTLFNNSLFTVIQKRELIEENKIKENQIRENQYNNIEEEYSYVNIYGRSVFSE